MLAGMVVGTPVGIPSGIPFGESVSYSSRMESRSRLGLLGESALLSDSSSSFLSAFFIVHDLSDVGDELVIRERSRGLGIGFGDGAARRGGFAHGHGARDS